MTSIKVCDRCGNKIQHSDELVRDFIDNRSDGDICESCYLSSELIAIASKQDFFAQQKPGTTIKKMLENYYTEQK
jgi:hypothetical protein